MFRSVDITLAGVPAPARAVRPAFPMHTLIVSGTDLSGGLDTGDTISVFNIDDPVRSGAGLDDHSFFYPWTARFSVPAGHYYAIADFCCARSAEHVVIVPQFTVSKAAATTTLQVTERSATSRISFTTQAGTLQSETQATLTSPSSARGIP